MAGRKRKEQKSRGQPPQEEDVEGDVNIPSSKSGDEKKTNKREREREEIYKNKIREANNLDELNNIDKDIKENTIEIGKRRRAGDENKIEITSDYKNELNKLIDEKRIILIYQNYIYIYHIQLNI